MKIYTNWWSTYASDNVIIITSSKHHNNNGGIAIKSIIETKRMWKTDNNKKGIFRVCPFPFYSRQGPNKVL